MCRTIAQLDAEITACRACPRLVAWREQVAHDKRASFSDENYWGRPVPAFGPGDARLLVVGLAPAAHGGNRTGRMFTGDRSADFLIAAMHAAGLSNQSTSVRADDGLRLLDTRMTAPVHCAPPDNKPTPTERDTCRRWLVSELTLMAPYLRAIVVLGGWGWQALLPALAESGWAIPKPRPRFAHGAHVELSPARDRRSPLHLFGTYHPSQQNTFTGRLTPAMLEAVLRDAKRAADEGPA